MQVRNLKLLFFSTDESDIKCFDLTLKKFISLLALFSVVVVALIGTATYLSVRFYQNYILNQLRRQNSVLISQLSTMEQKVSTLNARLEELEEFDNDLRIIADLPVLDEDVREVGIGGSSANSKFEDLPVALNKLVQEVNLEMAKLERKIDLEFGSFREIEGKLKSDKKRIRHTPSIRPIRELEGRLKSPFGKRRDPFIDVIVHHNGIDIAAEKGTTIFSPADGVVTIVSSEKRLGRYIKIEHGYGTKTLFGHLSDIKVKRGQKVKRWDPIGEVGRTGRATGYHLHYIVKLDGKSVDPSTFIYDVN